MRAEIKKELNQLKAQALQFEKYQENVFEVPNHYFVTKVHDLKYIPRDQTGSKAFDVPVAYFDQKKRTLKRIPSSYNKEEERPSVWRFRPFFNIAASLSLLFFTYFSYQNFMQDKRDTKEYQEFLVQYEEELIIDGYDFVYDDLSNQFFNEQTPVDQILTPLFEDRDMDWDSLFLSI